MNNTILKKACSAIAEAAKMVSKSIMNACQEGWEMYRSHLKEENKKLAIQNVIAQKNTMANVVIPQLASFFQDDIHTLQLFGIDYMAPTHMRVLDITNSVIILALPKADVWKDIDSGILRKFIYKLNLDLPRYINGGIRLYGEGAFFQCNPHIARFHFFKAMDNGVEIFLLIRIMTTQTTQARITQAPSRQVKVI